MKSTPHQSLVGDKVGAVGFAWRKAWAAYHKATLTHLPAILAQMAGEYPDTMEYVDKKGCLIFPKEPTR